MRARRWNDGSRRISQSYVSKTRAVFCRRRAAEPGSLLMSDKVQFGLNTFRRPAGASSTQGWNTTEWLKQTRARRFRQLHSEHTVNGQEVTPQHQRQQLLAQVESAQRPELLALFSLMIERH